MFYDQLCIKQTLMLRRAVKTFRVIKLTNLVDFWAIFAILTGNDIIMMTYGVKILVEDKIQPPLSNETNRKSLA